MNENSSLEAYKYLQKKDIPFKLLNTADESGNKYENFTKNVVFKNKDGKLYLCIIGKKQTVDDNLLKEILEEVELKQLDSKEIENIFDFELEILPPFGLKKDIEVLIDINLQNKEILQVQSGKKDIGIFLKPKELMKASRARFVNIVEKEERTNWSKLYLEEKYLPRIESARELNQTAHLRNIKDHVGKEVTLCGWIYNKRSSGKIQFLMIRDGSGDIQAVVEKSEVDEQIWNKAEELTIESSLQISGKIRKDERSPFGYEMDVTNIKIIQIASEYPIARKKHGPDFLLNNRHLWLRSKKQRAVLQIRDEIFFSLISFLREEGFVRIDTPIFQPVSCEDTSELFEVEYFGEKTYLTQSGQLYCEAAEFALGRTYDFGPVFRAEKSKTRKHLIEFWMMDAELPFTDLDGLMDFEEAMLKRIISDCLKNCSYPLKVLKRDTDKLKKYVEGKFERITHKKAIDLLKENFDLKLTDLDDIGAKEEVKLAELYDMPVFITDWPAEIKAFYMPKFKELGLEKVRSVDLMAADGFGEICGGSEREFDFNKLLKILEEKGYPYKDYEWYLDLRKYGTIPHSGFGIGMERTVRWISGIKHIRETIPFPRMLNRMRP